MEKHSRDFLIDTLNNLEINKLHILSKTRTIRKCWFSFFTIVIYQGLLSTIIAKVTEIIVLLYLIIYKLNNCICCAVKITLTHIINEFLSVPVEIFDCLNKDIFVKIIIVDNQ